MSAGYKDVFVFRMNDRLHLNFLCLKCCTSLYYVFSALERVICRYYGLLLMNCIVLIFSFNKLKLSTHTTTVSELLTKPHWVVADSVFCSKSCSLKFATIT